MTDRSCVVCGGAITCPSCADATACTSCGRAQQRSSTSTADATARLVASFSTYPFELLLDELVQCTVRWNVGPLELDERRIATALLDRLAILGIARKKHRVGCEIWPGHTLCDCPWEIAS